MLMTGGIYALMYPSKKATSIKISPATTDAAFFELSQN
jgi:hypothetical protein